MSLSILLSPPYFVYIVDTDCRREFEGKNEEYPRAESEQNQGL